jgi:hypothetical protein
MMTDEQERFVDDMTDRVGADGAVAVPLRHRGGAYVIRVIEGERLVGVALFVPPSGDGVRAATVQEQCDARLNRGTVEHLR